MAYGSIKNFLSLTYRDERQDERNRRVELGPAVVITETDVLRWHNVSKSAVAKFVQQNVQSDPGLSPQVGSEKRDTMRLYFRMGDESIGHLDIPDPVDDLFLATSGPNANTVIDKADMDAALAGTPEDELGEIIDGVLAGTYRIKGGQTPSAYLRGERVTAV